MYRDVTTHFIAITDTATTLVNGTAEFGFAQLALPRKNYNTPASRVIQLAGPRDPLIPL